MAVNIVSRVQKILMSPKSEWDVIDKEPTDTTAILTTYAVPLILLGAIVAMLAAVIFVHAPIVSLLVGVVIAVIVGVVGIFLFAFIFNAIAPSLGATSNFGQAFKLAAYFPTAYWIAAVAGIIPIPIIALLIILAGGLYSLYLLFLGAPKLMKAAADKAMTYGLACVGVVVVVGVILYVILYSIGGMGGMGGVGSCQALARSASERAQRGELPNMDELRRLQECATTGR